MARYWRISGIQTASNSLALAAFALSDGTTDYPASVLTGALSSGFKLEWDLGADVAVSQLKMTSTVSADWPNNLLLENSVDGVTWVVSAQVGAITYPGDATGATITPGGSGTTPPVVRAINQPSSVTHIVDEYMPEAGVALVPSGITALDQLDGGTHNVIGTVAEKALPANTPLVRRVVLIDERSHRVVRETWSDTAGNYEFASVNANTAYTVLSYDHTNTYRAVIADNLTPTPT